MTRRCSECGREDPTVYAGLCHSCLMKKSGVKPLGDAIIEPTVPERPKPEPKRERDPRSLTDLMRKKGWR